MFLEKMFGNLFGLIWLILFSLGVLGLLIWLIIKKEHNILTDEEDEGVILIAYKNFYIEKKGKNSFDVSNSEGLFIRKFDSLEDAKFYVDTLLLRAEEINGSGDEKGLIYEIIEIDGVFKVRKKGSERTLRKFDNEKDALNYVKEKENNDRPKSNR